ncbi:hypothetical protein NA57DRAFT_81370 [Rhizodiscina lignyota]|uniref:Heterokaryon incompatibility domain-containing protein n=1 Tax=Rhizodiscina lignyota TaxID=1504668 RepID=A0A9P4I5R8_9PEZI|nr:hypothetical protein NA57DRAFT_81370 [Rhizodiscina lignyota]
MLVDVVDNCLVRTSGKPRYASLSYVWGPSKQAFTSTKANVNELFVPGSLERHTRDLSATVSDAIVLTRQLGIRYLWADRMCIVQDDEEDVREQISGMAQIYEGAYINIVAATGSNAESGLPGVTVPRDQSGMILFTPYS